MGLFWGYFEVFKACSCGDDGIDFMFTHKFLVCGCIEVSEYKLASAFDGIGRQDDMVGTVFLLCIIIMKHELL